MLWFINCVNFRKHWPCYNGTVELSIGQYTWDCILFMGDPTGIKRLFVVSFSTDGIKWMCIAHDDVIKWKHFPRYWPFVRGIHRSPVNSPHKGQWRGALMFSLVSVWINGWVNHGDVGDLRRYRANYDITVMGRSQEPLCTLRMCVCAIDSRYSEEP